MRSTPLLLFSVLLLTAIPLQMHASWADPGAGQPVLRVLGPADYGSAAQNWCVVRDLRGRLFIGNDGVRIFDGRSWFHIDLGHVAPVRDLELDEQGRVWVAADGDLGWIEEATDGSCHYHSLRPQLPADSNFSGWSVFRQDGHTLFVGMASVEVWDGERFEQISLPNRRRLFAYRFRDGVAICQDDTLWLWRRGELEPVDLGELRRAVWGFRCRDGSELLRVEGGLCRLTEAGPIHIPRALTEVMHGGLENEAIRISEDFFCVSTLNAGLFILDETGTIVRRIGRENGLPSQSCFRMHLDGENGLWVATSRAVVRLDARLLTTRFDGSNGLPGGAVRLVMPTTDSMLAFSEEATCELVPRPGQPAVFSRLPGQQYHYWDVLEVEGQLLFGGMRALVSHVRGRDDVALSFPTDVFRLVKVPGAPRRVYASLADRIVELEAGSPPTLTGQTVAENVPGALDLAFDAHGTLWAAVYRRGLYKIDRAEPGARPEPLRPLDISPGNLSEPRLFSLGGVVYAYNQAEVWRLPRRGETGPRLELTGLGLAAAERAGTTHTWAIAGRGSDLQLVRLEAREDDGNLVATMIECPGLVTLGGVVSIARDHAGTSLWLGGNNGCLRLDLTAPRVESPPPAPAIMRIEHRRDDGPGILLPLAGHAKVDFAGAGALSFDLRDRSDGLGRDARLQARLLGRDASWAASGLIRTYTGLREGSYEFQARAVDLLGRASPVTTFTVTVLPPWFRTGWAYAGYVLAGVVVVTSSAQLWAYRIKRRNLLLEQIVKQRTEELQRAMTARTAFLANMGHEIRNPLNGVVGLVEMLRTSGEDPDQRARTVNRLGICADQLVSVVEDVLEFSKVDAGQIPIRPQPFQIRQPVEATVEIFRAAEPTRSISVEASESDMEGRVVGDPSRIRQVLVNYVANALKFAPTGPVTVGVEKRGDGFIFSVADQGPGIPRDHQARLFVRFSRGSFAHREGIPGSGLGLAACRAYAEAMGGEVWVESEPGHGATFYLRVPLRPAEAGDVSQTTIVPDIMAGRDALLVDDHEFNRIVLSDLLARMGASPRAVPDVASAQTAFNARLPDVVFVDFDLAGATGADLARWIRHEAPAGRDVPIVATSAFEVEEIRQRCAQSGMDGFIAKPVTIHKVAEVMSRIEAIRTGGVVPEMPTAPAASSAAGKGFLDLLSDGDPVRRRELEKSAWRDVRTEASAALRHVREANLTEAGRRAHRLTSAAVMLGLSEVVALSRQMTGAARSANAAGTREAANALRKALAQARRQLRDGG